MDYVNDLGDRDARIRNNAKFYVENYNKWVKEGVEAISYRHARESVRKIIGLKSLPGGEKKWGDHRANGDAWGGHGLKLERIIHKNRKCFLINEENYKTCKNLLNGNGHRPKILL